MHLSASLFVVCSVAALAACGPSPSPAAPAPRPAPASADAALASLSTRDKIAQLVMPWIPGSYTARDEDMSAQVRRWVDSLHIGGVIVSIGSPLDIAAKLNDLQRRSRLPLLVASDLEAGTSIRFNGGTPFPSNMGVGAAGREQDAYAMGRITALEARVVGIHIAFAPVADVNNNPANPIINTRSFGEDPHAVANLVAAEVRGMQANGLLATVKHFPGHGNTGTDTHIALPTNGESWSQLDSIELVPFRAAVAAGVAGVMSAHIAMAGVDSGEIRPATVSPAVLTGILRDSLGFHGLAVTDALNMGGVVSRYGGGEAAVLAFLAGADLLLQPADPAATIDAMEQAVRSGRITAARLDESVRKLLAIKQRFGLFTRRTADLDSVTAVVGSAAFLDTARDVAARSIVLASDSGGAVDSLRARRGRVTVIAYGDETSPATGATLIGELRRLGDTVTAFRLQPASGPASYDSARVALAVSPAAVFAVGVRYHERRGTIAMPDSLAALIEVSAAERPSVLVSFGTPYLVSQTPHVGSYLLAWVSNPVCEAAAAAALAGAPITGRLPISIPPRYPLGGGLARAAGPTMSAGAR